MFDVIGRMINELLSIGNSLHVFGVCGRMINVY